MMIKFLILIVFVFVGVLPLSAQINELVIGNDTLYTMTRQTRDQIYENLQELKQRRLDTISYNKEIALANERISILKDSIVLLLMPKKDSINNAIIVSQKPKSVKIDGLFVEGDAGYLGASKKTFISLGAFLNIKLWMFAVAPGFKGFAYNSEYDFGPFLRVGVRVY